MIFSILIENQPIIDGSNPNLSLIMNFALTRQKSNRAFKHRLIEKPRIFRLFWSKIRPNINFFYLKFFRFKNFHSLELLDLELYRKNLKICVSRLRNSMLVRRVKT